MILQDLFCVVPRKIPRNSALKGFSLLELLIYIAILASVLLVISQTFIYLNRGRGQAEARSEVNSNLRFAVEKIASDIRASSSITTPANASSTSSTLVMTVSGQTITYDVSAGQLRRQAGASTPEPITTTNVTIATPTFLRLENTNTVLSRTAVSIEVDISASYNSSSPDSQYSERKKTTASLR